MPIGRDGARGTRPRQAGRSAPRPLDALLRVASSILLVAALLPLPRPSFAEVMAWEGTLTLDFLAPSLPDVVVTGRDVAIAIPLAGGPGLATLRLRGGITGTGIALVTDPELATFAAVAATVTLGIGTLRPFQPPGPSSQRQLVDNTLLVAGAARLCFFSADCSAALLLPLGVNHGTRGLGVGGLLTLGGSSDVRVSLSAAPWTVGTTAVSISTTFGATTSVPAFGFAHGPLSFTGSTATAGGELQLVTPMATTSTQGPVLTGFAVLTIRLIPEPGLLLLLVSGVIGLILIGRGRIRS